MKTRTGVYDEYGTPWLVKAGDPANERVNLLQRRGFSYIVLPRALLCGIMEVRVSNPDYLDDPIAGARLRRCLEELCDTLPSTSQPGTSISIPSAMSK